MIKIKKIYRPPNINNRKGELLSGYYAYKNNISNSSDRCEKYNCKPVKCNNSNNSNIDITISYNYTPSKKRKNIKKS